MKATRKLIPALAMLLISAVMLSTASFAWFSMNKEVEVTGMNVTAQSDASTLVILAGANQEIGADTAKTKVESSLGGTLLPITPVNALTVSNIEEETNWKYGYSESTSVSTQNVKYTTLADGANLLLDSNADTKDYVAKESFTIGLQNTTTGASSVSNLKLTGLTISNLNAGITVVVTCGTGESAKLYTHTTNVTNGTEVLAATIDKSQPVTVNVYIYFDGENENVTTEKIASLKGTVALTFAVD